MRDPHAVPVLPAPERAHFSPLPRLASPSGGAPELPKPSAGTGCSRLSGYVTLADGNRGLEDRERRVVVGQQHDLVPIMTNGNRCSMAS